MDPEREVDRFRDLYRTTREALRWWKRKDWEENHDRIGVQQRIREFDEWTEYNLEGTI